MIEAVEPLLACPVCNASLVRDGIALRCDGCLRQYGFVEGVPRLIPDDLTRGPEWDEWAGKQELGRREYEQERNSAAFDEVAAAFAGFAALSGLVLDVGCGIDGRPAYADFDGTYVGVDPLRGDLDRDFPFVQAVAEHLPFRAATFDTVVSATVLDHVPDPARALVESRRVLKTDGRLAVWVGVVDATRVGRALSAAYRTPRDRRRAVLELAKEGGIRRVAGAAWRYLVTNRIRSVAARVRATRNPAAFVADVFADRARYHFRFFDEAEILRLVRGAGFRVVARRALPTPDGTASLFVIAKPEVHG